jgi:hypothetical protein
MKENLIKIYLILCTAIAIVFFVLLMAKPAKTVVVEKSSRAYNDSVLVSEYQKALDIYMDKHPKEADKFIQIIEEINTK